MRVLLEGGDGSGGSKEYVEGVVGEGGVKSSRCLKSKESWRVCAEPKVSGRWRGLVGNSKIQS